MICCAPLSTMPIIRSAHRRAAADAARTAVDVVGPICESTDVFARGRDLPPVRAGDLVAFTGAGATARSWLRITIRPRAAEVMVEGAQFAVVKPRIEPAARFADEAIPPWLTTAVMEREQLAERRAVMTSSADPRGSWAFRRRVALAQLAGGFEAAWSAAWPSLMVIGAFLVVSLLGLWAMLPAWLHALGLLAFLAGLLWTGGARAMPGAGPITAPACAAWSRSTGCRTSRCARSAIASGGGDDSATRLLWRRHLERLRQAVRNLKVGPPRSDLPRRDPWALRAALVLLLLVGFVQAGGMAPERLVQAFEIGRGDRIAAIPLETTVWVTPPTYTGRPPLRLQAAPPPTAEATVQEPQQVEVPAGSEVLAQLHHFRAAAERFALASTRNDVPSRPSGRTAPKRP